MSGRTFTFAVEHMGEPDAGMYGFSDTVHVTVESGEPGEIDGPDGFRAFLRSVLAEWYDGATVTDAYPDGTPLFEGDSLDHNPQGATPPTPEDPNR